jgi:phage terminase large subunit
MTNTAAYFGSSRIIFDGIKSSSPSKLKSIEGLSVFVVDEASDIMREEEFDTIDQSIRAKGRDSLTILILNPTTPEHWIYKRFFDEVTFHKLYFQGQEYTYPIIKNENVIHVHTTFLDNLQNLNESFLNIAKETQKRNEQRFINQYLGLFVDWDGARILQYEIVQNIDRSLPCAIGVDFGYYPDPSAICRVYVDNKNKLVYVEGLLYAHKLSAKELSNEIITYENYRIVCDTNIKPITEPLRLNGAEIYYKNMRIELRQQLAKMAEYKILIYENDISTLIANEVSSYRWIKNEPVQGYGDHAIDAFRYAAFPIILNEE